MKKTTLFISKVIVSVTLLFQHVEWHQPQTPTKEVKKFIYNDSLKEGKVVVR